MSIIGVLTVVFITLKLLGVIDWSWLVVFLPLIIGVLIDIIVFIIATIFLKKF